MTHNLSHRLLPGLLLLLALGACDMLWPLDSPYDQRRCDPQCTGGEVCEDGQCQVPKVGGDASPRDTGHHDVASHPDLPGPSKDGAKQDKPKQDKPKDDKGLCIPAMCIGCCQGSVCKPGNSIAACGTGGQPCQACGPGEACTGGACKSSGCGPSNCPGCCKGGACIVAINDTACGSGGAQCVACKKYQGCQAGACKLNHGSQWKVTLIKAEIDKGKVYDQGPNPHPDPFVEVSVGPTKGKTTTKMNTYSPMWNELVLTTTAGDLFTHGLSVNVWDQDGALANQLIGSCKVTLAESVLLSGSGIMVCGKEVKQLKFAFSPL